MGSIEFDLSRYEHQEAVADKAYQIQHQEIEADAEARAEEMLKSAEWWEEMLLGDNGATGALPLVLSDCMRNLDRACADDAISTQAILSALSRLQKAASLEAYREAFDLAEQEAVRA